MVGSDASYYKSWFSRGNKCNIKSVFGTWREADMFKRHWKRRAGSYKKFDRGGIGTYNYTWPGDVVSLLNRNGNAYHTLICVGYYQYNHSTICFCHSGDSPRNLSNVSVPLIVYHMRGEY